jgi:hypothetical protein
VLWGVVGCCVVLWGIVGYCGVLSGVLGCFRTVFLPQSICNCSLKIRRTFNERLYEQNIAIAVEVIAIPDPYEI